MKKRQSWGYWFLWYLRKGYDHGYAAHRADLKVPFHPTADREWRLAEERKG